MGYALMLQSKKFVLRKKMKRLFFVLVLLLAPLSALENLDTKSGFILGVEASFGSPIDYEGSSELLGVASIMGGLYSGYQYYFDHSFGIKTLFSIHDSTPVIAKLNQNIEISAIPLWIGGRIDILWDFWRSEQHSIGISLGIEYASEIYRSREAKINKNKYSLSSISQHNLYPLLGFYYHYKNNQFSLDYRFEGALRPKSHTEIINNTPINSKYKFNETLNLSYAYRF